MVKQINARAGVLASTFTLKVVMLCEKVVFPAHSRTNFTCSTTFPCYSLLCRGINIGVDQADKWYAQNLAKWPGGHQNPTLWTQDNGTAWFEFVQIKSQWTCESITTSNWSRWFPSKTRTLAHVTQKLLWFPPFALPHMFSQDSEVTRSKGCCGGEQSYELQILTISAQWALTGLANKYYQSQFAQRWREKKSLTLLPYSLVYLLLLSDNWKTLFIKKWLVVLLKLYLEEEVKLLS